MIIQGQQEATTTFRIKVRENGRDENDGLGKDDWHHTGTVNLQRQELTGAAELPVTYDLFGIVDRHLSYALNQQDTSHDDGNQNCNLNNKDQDLTIPY